MQKKTRIALAAGAAAVLAATAITGLAHANRGWRHGGHHHAMMQMAERYDANKDGKISQEEIDQNRTERHGEFDSDKNGTLSLEEFKGLWLKANQERMVREFQEFDSDGNAQVTLDEYKSPLAQTVATMDRNNDGVLSKEDRRDEGGKRHHRMQEEAPAENKTGG
ncbi:MAG TPA: EF-hand domain-containing protein [Aestuariivirga sp.]|nr:EF-hand domain-containing protein [Aestuariivirga sp.]